MQVTECFLLYASARISLLKLKSLRCEGINEFALRRADGKSIANPSLELIGSFVNIARQMRREGRGMSEAEILPLPVGF